MHINTTSIIGHQSAFLSCNQKTHRSSSFFPFQISLQVKMDPQQKWMMQQ